MLVDDTVVVEDVTVVVVLDGTVVVDGVVVVDGTVVDVAALVAAGFGLDVGGGLGGVVTVNLHPISPLSTSPSAS